MHDNHVNGIGSQLRVENINVIGLKGLRTRKMVNRLAINKEIPRNDLRLVPTPKCFQNTPQRNPFRFVGRVDGSDPLIEARIHNRNLRIEVSSGVSTQLRNKRMPTQDKWTWNFRLRRKGWGGIRA